MYGLGSMPTLVTPTMPECAWNQVAAVDSGGNFHCEASAYRAAEGLFSLPLLPLKALGVPVGGGSFDLTGVILSGAVWIGLGLWVFGGKR